jgi:hypothetical protein
MGASRVPRKVLRHFPIIPRLQRMFGTEAQSNLMTWHSKNKSVDGKMRMVADNPQWRFVDTQWPDFGAEPRNIRLGLAADGLNPFAEKRSNWSTWPISLINFNLPPWLATKKHFIILALIIPGPECVSAENIDIFLEPLVDELMLLWQDGVQTRDAAAEEGARIFNMKAMLVMTIHDLEAYSIINGCTVRGKHGCPKCGPNCVSWYSFSLSKNVYNAQYRRWLPPGHPYRQNYRAFDGTVEERQAPTNVTAAQTMTWAEERGRWLAAGGAPAREDPAHRTGVKRLSILFRLPYWKVSWLLGLVVCIDTLCMAVFNRYVHVYHTQDLPLRGSIDVMHVERNLCSSLLKLLLGMKDTAEVRKDLEEEGIRQNLWLRHSSVGPNFVKPHAPYTFKPQEKRVFMNTLGNVIAPTGYAACFAKHVGPRRLSGLKSHDFHVILQQILPVVVRNLMAVGPRTAIIRLGRCFTKICAKVIDVREMDNLRLYVVETMCMLERWFPPSFFDISVHLVVHLVDELEVLGPVATRWCYPVERFMSVLKGYVRNRSKPEGSMAMGYTWDASLGFITEYLDLYPHTRRRMWDPNEEEMVAGEVLQGAATTKTLTGVEQSAIHDYVVHNYEATQELLRY